MLEGLLFITTVICLFDEIWMQNNTGVGNFITSTVRLDSSMFAYAHVRDDVISGYFQFHVQDHIHYSSTGIDGWCWMTSPLGPLVSPASGSNLRALLKNLTGNVTRLSSRLSQWIDNLEEVIKFLGDQKNKTMEAGMFFLAANGCRGDSESLTALDMTQKTSRWDRTHTRFDL